MFLVFFRVFEFRCSFDRNVGFRLESSLGRRGVEIGGYFDDF